MDTCNTQFSPHEELPCESPNSHGSLSFSDKWHNETVGKMDKRKKAKLSGENIFWV